MNQKQINDYEDSIFDFILNRLDDVSVRIGKFLAMYYPNALVRKKFSKYIGVEMGDKTYANMGMKVVQNANDICVHIGNNVSIGPNVTFLCGSDPNNGVEIKNFEYIKNVTYYKDIWVEDEVWIGANCVIFPGVRLGKCSVIGSGSVVRRDTEPYKVYVGVPAKKIKDIRTGKNE